MSKHDDLVKKLKEIFQIDKPELDFGIYRILNARVVEINDYLENRLKTKVQESLSKQVEGDSANKVKELTAKIRDEYGKRVFDEQGKLADETVKGSELGRQLIQLQSTAPTAAEHENAVFTHLLTFFSRYYDNGDFISQRRYKGDTYAIPYAGEEVMLHWANKDQYYTKSGENFSNYAFKLDDGRSVRFRLVTADTAKDNRKDNDKERRFVLIDPHTRSLATNGLFIKTNKSYDDINKILSRPEIAVAMYNPESPFNVHKLIGQIEQECVWENDSAYGRKNDQQWGFCSTLVSRIANVISCEELSFVFKSNENPDISQQIQEFTGNKKLRLLRICMSGISQEYQTKEIIANALGRKLLWYARNRKFKQRPVVVIVDEAHNFLGKHIGSEDSAARLDAFELIAKEGRKYGLNICLATQRPRDITEGVLSQMGTLIVHRLTNDRDREVVERACGEIDRSTSAFLPNLKPGEAAIIGVDFPIPLTIQINKPTVKPQSDGPNFQECWSITATPLA